MNKKCTQCGLVKSIEYFALYNKAESRRHTKCKECEYKYYKQWYNRNRELRRVYNTALHRKKATGFTPEEYDAKFIKQKGRCAICNRYQSEFDRAFSADHCHKFGTKRGLLCTHCNVSLSKYELFKDEIDTYLDYYKELIEDVN